MAHPARNASADNILNPSRTFFATQVMNRESFETHRKYIAQNPVKVGLAATADEFPFCFRYLAKRKAEAKVGRG
ncbi:MAG: hypothetical protein ACP5E2_14465 [Terracidiphilus sp.]